MSRTFQQRPQTKRDTIRSHAAREQLIEALASSEDYPRTRQEWTKLLPPDSPMLKAEKNRSDKSYSILYAFFTGKELDQIEYEAIQRRLARSGGKTMQLLDRLWEQGMNGDTTAAKEYLNRILGSPQQRITMEHETGDNLTQLLHQISPSDAYKRPQIDADGREIINITPEEREAIEQDDSNQNET